MRMRLLLGALAAALLPAQVQRDVPIPPQPQVTAGEIAQGKLLFQGHCGGCHGPEGGGARGPNLARPKLRHATGPQSLFLVIDLGIEGTEMPGDGSYTTARSGRSPPTSNLWAKPSPSLCLATRKLARKSTTARATVRRATGSTVKADVKDPT